MAEKYFVIDCDEDGEISVRGFTHADLVKSMNDPFETPLDAMNDVERRAAGGDLNEWGRKCIIIKGKLVVPKAVEKVKEWEVE